MRPLDKIGEDVARARVLAQRMAGPHSGSDAFEAGQLRERLVVDALEMFGELMRTRGEVATLLDVVEPTTGETLRDNLRDSDNPELLRALEQVDKTLGRFIVCGPCSKAGGAGLPVWHDAPACPEEP